MLKLGHLLTFKKGINNDLPYKRSRKNYKTTI